ncbi:MAG: lipoyl(octanoyl) transferase, partial [Bacteroidota bacterium]
MNQNKVTHFSHLGLRDYKETWDLQEQIFSETVDRKIANRKRDPHKQYSTDNHLIFVYHPHVYTLGKSGKE